MDAIRVAVRVRPLNARELDGGSGSTWMVEENTITQCAASGKPIAEASYSFDRVFNTGTKTHEVYDTVARDIVKAAMEGINGTIFAYGQTSSGKTHTMMGRPEEPGVIPLAVNEIFDYIEEAENMEFLLRVSCMEIYNETITDLLDSSKTNLKVKENYDGDIYVGDLTEMSVTSPEGVIELLTSSLENRHVAATRMNEHSSRSHTVFKIIIESRTVAGGDDADDAIRVAQLNLVDLAGSERVANTGAAGDRLKEAGNINKSLLTLGSVIGKLSEGVKDKGHIPYRDSKLTRILQNSLGGNARTAVICAVTPATAHAEESLSSLKFANRAKNIKNHARVNEVLDEAAQMKRYKRMIAELEQQVAELSQASAAAAPAPADSTDADVEALKHEKHKLSAELMEKETLCQQQQAEVARLKSLIVPAGHSPRKGGGGGKSSKRPSRRETWAPGAVSRRSTRRSIGAGLLSAKKPPRRVSSAGFGATAAASGGGAYSAAPTPNTLRVTSRRGGAAGPGPVPSFKDAVDDATRVAQLERQVADQQSEISELSRQLEQSNANFEQFMTEHGTRKDAAVAAALAEARAEAEAATAELAEQLEAKQRECEHMAADMARLRETEEFIKEELEVLRGATSDAEAALAAADAAADAAAAASNDGSNGNSSADVDVEALKRAHEDEVAQLRADAADADAAHKDLVHYLEDTVKRLQDTGRTAQLEKHNAELADEVATVRSGAAEAQAEAEAARGEAEVLRGSLESAAEEINGLKARSTDGTGGGDGIGSGTDADFAAQLEAERAKAVSDLSAERDELLERVEAAIDAADRIRCELAANHDEMEQVLEQVRREHCDRTAALVAERDELAARLAAASTGEAEAGGDEVATLQNEVATLIVAEGDAARAEVEILRRGIEEAVEQMAQLRADHATQLDAVTAERDTLAAEVAKVKAEATADAGAVERLAEERSALADRLQTAERDAAEAVARADEAVTAADAARAACAERDAKVAALEAKLDEARQLSSDLDAVVSSQEAVAADDAAGLAAQLDEARAELAAVRAALAAAESDAQQANDDDGGEGDDGDDNSGANEASADGDGDGAAMQTDSASAYTEAELATMPTPKRKSLLSRVKSPFRSAARSGAKKKNKRKLFKKGSLNSPFADGAGPVRQPNRVDKLVTPAPKKAIDFGAADNDDNATTAAPSAAETETEADAAATAASAAALAEATARADAVAGELASVEAMLVASQKRVSELELEVEAASRQAAADAAADLAATSEALALARKERDAAAEEIERRDAAAQALRMESLDHAAKLQEDADAARAEAEVAAADRDSFAAKLAAVTDDLEAAAAGASASEEEKSELAAKLADASARLDAAMADLNTANAARDEVAARLTAAEGDLAAVRESAAALEERHAAEVATLRSEVEPLRSEVETLRAAAARLAELDAAAASDRDALAAATGEVETLRGEVAPLRERLEAAEVEREDLAGRVGGLQAELERAASGADGASKELQAECERLRSEAVATGKELAETKSALETVVAQNGEQEQAISEANARLSAAAAALAAKETELAEAVARQREAVAKLERDLDEAMGEIGQLNQVRDGLMDELTTAEQRLAEVASKQANNASAPDADVTAKAAAAEADAARLSGEVSALQRRLAAQAAQLQNVDDLREQEVTELQAHVTSLEAEVKRVRAQADAAKGAGEGASAARVAALEKQVAALQAALDAKAVEFAEAQTDAAAARAGESDLRTRVAALEARNAELAAKAASVSSSSGNTSSSGGGASAGTAAPSAAPRQPAPNMIDSDIIEKLHLENQAMRQQLAAARGGGGGVNSSRVSVNGSFAGDVSRLSQASVNTSVASPSSSSAAASGRTGSRLRTGGIAAGSDAKRRGVLKDRGLQREVNIPKPRTPVAKAKQPLLARFADQGGDVDGDADEDATPNADRIDRIRAEKRTRAKATASPQPQSVPKRRSPQPLTLSDGALDADDGAGECAQQ